MGFYALAISTILYVIVCIDLLYRKNYPLALIFFCYALANLGYIWMGYIEK